MAAHTFEFSDGRLSAIDDPGAAYDASVSGENWRWEDYCTHCGFCSCGDRIGPTDGEYAEIYGPSHLETYEWLVTRTVNGSRFSVWCEGFPELEEYLAKIAAELSARSLDSMRGTLEESNRWLFGWESGIFREHVRRIEREQREQSEMFRRQREAKAAAKTHPPAA